MTDSSNLKSTSHTAEKCAEMTKNTTDLIGTHAASLADDPIFGGDQRKVNSIVMVASLVAVRDHFLLNGVPLESVAGAMMETLGVALAAPMPEVAQSTVAYDGRA